MGNGNKLARVQQSLVGLVVGDKAFTVLHILKYKPLQFFFFLKTWKTIVIEHVNRMEKIKCDKIAGHYFSWIY